MQCDSRKLTNFGGGVGMGISAFLFWWIVLFFRVIIAWWSCYCLEVPTVGRRTMKARPLSTSAPDTNCPSAWPCCFGSCCQGRLTIRTTTRYSGINLNLMSSKRAHMFMHRTEQVRWRCFQMSSPCCFSSCCQEWLTVRMTTREVWVQLKCYVASESVWVCMCVCVCRAKS